MLEVKLVIDGVEYSAEVTGAYNTTFYMSDKHEDVTNSIGKVLDVRHCTFNGSNEPPLARDPAVQGVLVGLTFVPTGKAKP